MTSDERRRRMCVSAGQKRCHRGGAEGIRTPDLLIAKASPACLGGSATVHPVRLLLASQVRGRAGGARNGTARMVVVR